MEARELISDGEVVRRFGNGEKMRVKKLRDDLWEVSPAHNRDTPSQ